MIETKICPDCRKEVRMIMDTKGQFIKYDLMCPCIVEIMALREKQYKPEFKNPSSNYAMKRRMKLNG